MNPEDIPEQVLSFIAKHIDTVPHLETLILLWENQSQFWTQGQVAKRIYVSEATAGSVLNDLRQRRLVKAEAHNSVGYHYDHAWDPSSLIMAAVVHTYRHRVVEVATLIHSRGSSSVREFARAFDLKKDR
ncbi:MAG: hypothetical protein H7Y02_00270 [Candidatus Obscuribacterales bacterium]|nr:hypothetical protein [Steroidobacteraceae bacterium]